MITVISLLAVVLAETEVRVATLGDQTISGQLVELNADRIVVNTSTGTESAVPVGDVVDVSFARPKEADAESVEAGAAIQLRDGSALAILEVAATAEIVTATSRSLGELQIPRTVVRAVRLQPLEENQVPQWDAFLKRNNSKDMLIVAKRDGSGLDFLAGVVTSIGTEEVPFLLDGDTIPVPRARVFGIVFAAADAPGGLPDRNILVQIGDTDFVRAEAVELEDQQLKLKSSWGQALSVSVTDVSRIDFSSGRVHYLSDLEPISEQYFGLDPPGKEWGPLFDEDRTTRTGLSRQWKISRDSFPNSGRTRLTLRGQTYAKGLCIFPSARVEYALDGQYSALQAVVGVDDEVAFNQLKGKPSTAVELRIEADGEEVYRQLIHAPEDPLDLKLDLSGVNTLTITVDFGDGASTCDYLDIAAARLIVDTSAN